MTGLAPREAAAAVLGQVLSGGSILDDVLRMESRLARLDARDRAFARNLAATVLRRLGQIDSIIGSCLDRPLPRSGKGARMALRLGLCQILFLDTRTHAAVDTSVALARRHGPEKFSGVVNAVLRRVARGDRDRLLTRHPPSLNVPDWLRRSWTAAYGDEATAEIAAVHLMSPPLDLTVRNDPAAWAERLGGEHLWADSVRIRSGGVVSELDGYADGAWWVQDVAATLPARLLARNVAPGARVLDMCAAPGGKTAQLAAAGFDVTAVDMSPERLQLVAENLQRLGLSAQLVAADATDWTVPHPFDAVLVDAPCSATGTIRRHPDIPLVRTHAEVERLARIQARLLGAASALAAPDGIVVYSVCSLEVEEGQGIVEAACGEGSGLGRDPVGRGEVEGLPVRISDAGDVRTLPSDMADRGGMDGFFVSRLRKAA